MTTSDFNQNPIGAGPYKLTSWDMGQAIVLEKFDDYYQGSPNIDTVVFKIVEDTDARALQLESGELNFAQITPTRLTGLVRSSCSVPSFFSSDKSFIVRSGMRITKNISTVTK